MYLFQKYKEMWQFMYLKWHRNIPPYLFQTPKVDDLPGHLKSSGILCSNAPKPAWPFYSWTTLNIVKQLFVCFFKH